MLDTMAGHQTKLPSQLRHAAAAGTCVSCLCIGQQPDALAGAACRTAELFCFSWAKHSQLELRSHRPPTSREGQHSHRATLSNSSPHATPDAAPSRAC